MAGAIYLDYNATTPVDPAVAAAMAPLLEGGLRGAFGNPSSLHGYRRAPKAALAAARATIARALRAPSPDCVLFESGGTESIAHVVKGTAMAAWREQRAAGVKPHIITSAIEHVAVLDSVAWCVEMGFAESTVVGVGADGAVSAADVVAAVTPATVLVTIMLANNETGECVCPGTH